LSIGGLNVSVPEFKDTENGFNDVQALINGNDLFVTY
jgi:hypothetical protein